MVVSIPAFAASGITAGVNSGKSDAGAGVAGDGTAGMTDVSGAGSNGATDAAGAAAADVSEDACVMGSNEAAGAGFVELTTGAVAVEMDKSPNRSSTFFFFSIGSWAWAKMSSNPASLIDDLLPASASATGKSRSNKSGCITRGVPPRSQNVTEPCW